MSRPITISIPKPCHENWQEMTATERGAFCKSCQKEVIDFSRKTDDETYRIFEAADYNLCGKFRIDQLNKPLYKTTYIKSNWHWKAIAASFIGLIGYNDIQAKNPPSVSLHFANDTSNRLGNHKPEISGFVVNEYSKPVANASIAVLDTLQHTLAVFQSDSTGRFLYYPGENSNIPDSFLLKVWTEETSSITPQTMISGKDIRVVINTTTLEDLMAVGGPFVKINTAYKIRRFFRRLFQR